MKIKKVMKKTGKVISAPVRKPYKHFKHKRQEHKAKKEFEEGIINLYNDKDFMKSFDECFENFSKRFSTVVAEEDPIVVEVE